MREKKDITLFRYIPNENCWRVVHIKGVDIRLVKKISAVSERVDSGSRMIIRIKLKNPDDIYLGDKIAVGIKDITFVENAMNVVEIHDNNKGSSYVRHYKIVCEG